MPVPTIMPETLAYLPCALRTCLWKQRTFTVDEFVVNKMSFRSQAVRPGRRRAVDVQHGVAVGNQPVGQEHAMAVKPHALGAHVGSARRFAKAEQLRGP